MQVRNFNRRGLQVSNINANVLANKPKPLQASTNTIHVKQQKLLKDLKGSSGENDPIKKHISTPKKATKERANSSKEKATTKEKINTPKVKSVDENDVGPFIDNPYDPLKHIHQFDEELYQKVLKLEMADDGLPSCISDEPFDF